MKIDILPDDQAVAESGPLVGDKPLSAARSGVRPTSIAGVPGRAWPGSCARHPTGARQDARGRDRLRDPERPAPRRAAAPVYRQAAARSVFNC